MKRDAGIQRFIRAVGVACACFPLLAEASPADDMKLLLEQGKPQEAYQQGLRFENLLGNPRFDFFFGVAAINGGQPSTGVLALERYLLNFPDNDNARIELARGYFLIGDDARSREEFEAMLLTKPSAEVAKVVTEYLDAIKARASKYSTVASFYLELGGGHDSNPVSGVADSVISLPVFGTVTLADSALAKPDRFNSVSLGGQVSTPLYKNLSAFGGGAVDIKRFRDTDAFNENDYALSTGLNLTSGANVYRFTLGGSSQLLNNSRYRNTRSVNGDWGYQLSADSLLTGGLQAARFDYAAANVIRDADYYSLTVGYRRQFASWWRPGFDFSLSGARESNKYSDHQELSRDLYGVRAAMSASPFKALSLNAGVAFLRSNYRAPDPLLQTTRRDDYLAYDISATYLLTSAWSVRTEYLDSRNRSNLAIYTYKRRTAQVKVRYDYK